jgi:hypothetical protein
LRTVARLTFSSKSRTSRHVRGLFGSLVRFRVGFAGRFFRVVPIVSPPPLPGPVAAGRPQGRRLGLPPFVDAKNVDATVRRFSVYKKGTSITVRSFGLSPYVSHPSVRTEADIQREITLVFKVTVTGVKHPRELN